MELTDYLRIVRRSWRLVAAVVLATIAAAALLTAMTPRDYRAEADLYVSITGGESVSDLVQGGSFTQRQVATYADIVTTPVVLSPVVEELQLTESVNALAGRVTATVPPNTVLINVSVVDADPSQAASIANAVATQFMETIQELEQTSAGAESPVKATVVRPATAPLGPVSPDPLRNIALATVLGLLLGLGLGILRDLLDTRVRGEGDLARVTEEPVLGAIAHDNDATSHPLVMDIDPHSQRAEAFRTLRTNLQFAGPDTASSVIVVTSSIPGEGKSTTTANLALTLAASEHSVCLVEGDLRRPRLLEYLGLENAAGLTDVLIDRADLEDVLQPHARNLRVLGSGMIPPNPSELLGSHSMRHLVGQLRENFDYVIIDSPPLIPVTDAAVLSSVADGVLVVVGAGMVKRDQLERVLGSLNKVGANVLGMVLNRLPMKGPDAYSYEYQTYEADPVGKRAEPTRARRKDQSGVKGY
ncbi:polysaccharide biosynthesis tyrosine autokinase [Ornithinimicrobium cerasi]|uniref:polysaccharide biosynthesis tyrosine autokinase n=1 Tax=Ornithinimicrobium cerasi TaxID=2248773 RepID=UPI000EFE75AE|nr:polysaccharide biosynthesis tyrosine autokinase [Ornithinimicrobium cerasi]